MPSPLRFQERFGARLTILALSGILGSTLSLLLLPPARGSSEGSARELKFLGEPLPLDHGAIDVALDRARRQSDREVTLVLPDAHAEVISLDRLGVTIDTARISQFIRDARDGTSRLSRTFQSRHGTEVLTMPLPFDLDPDAATGALLGLKDKFDRPPENARIDVGEKRVLPDAEGRYLDVDRTLARLGEALGRGELRVEAAIERVPAKRRIQDLTQVSFEAVLGHFETRYSRAKTAEARTYNLRRAASRVDGTVLFPGEVFDFNEIVGPRDEANGYKVATVISDGELADGIGGGTCQVSGTLHGAVFFAGLEIVERYPHTRPSSYIKMGLDATVVYPTINFRFKNKQAFPVVLHETVKDGEVHAEVLGPKADQVVTLIRKIDEALPFEELERPAPELPKGQRRLAQRGVPGFRLHRYRIVRRGNHTERERWRDVYPPTSQIIELGTGEANDERTKSKKSDGAPEYVADELLILTLKRSSDSDPGEFAENREPGPYGEAGWTLKRGMPFWATETPK
jgi:vancomycin resistance protein YoaR